MALRATAALAPGGVLRAHFGNRLRLRQGSALRSVRQAQDLAGFQAVDVAVKKGIRVKRLNGQHRLLDRGAIAVLCGNFPQGVAGRGGVLGRRAGGRCGTGWRGAGRRARRRGRLVELGRIEQHAVVTHQTAIGPLHLHEEAHVGIGQRLAGGHAHHAATFGVDHRGERQVIEERLAVDTRVYEGLGRRQAGGDLGRREAAHIAQFDFHGQRLVQLRLEGHLPKLQRLRHTGGQRRGGRYC